MLSCYHISFINKMKTQNMNSSQDKKEAIFKRIEQAIAEGVWQYGYTIPKARYLCSEWHISATTLQGALKIAEAKGIVHREGKPWVVGAEIKNTLRNLGKTSPPAIVVVSNRIEEWSDFHQNLLAGFVLSFGAEANRHNIRLIPALTGLEKGESAFASGKDEINALIKNLGPLYMGAVMTPLRSTTPDMDNWLRFLGKFKRPVVWMQDESPSLKIALPAQVYRISYGDWEQKSGHSSAQVAINSLVVAGHRKVIMPYISDRTNNWIEDRIQKLIKASAEHPDLVFGVVRAASLKTLIQKILLSDATALIVPSDDFALDYFRALYESNKKIPEDYSLVSFDNRYSLKPYPISTVDFGLEKLGYQAFHLIFGVIPIRVSRRNQLYGENSLRDNGSITPPKLN
jgi:DNA-binding transcriptional regulator YhcF (GntR family)